MVPGEVDGMFDPGPAFGADRFGFGGELFRNQPVHEVGVDQIAFIVFGKEIALDRAAGRDDRRRCR